MGNTNSTWDWALFGRRPTFLLKERVVFAIASSGTGKLMTEIGSPVNTCV
jgi:hypothetical protein